MLGASAVFPSLRPAFLATTLLRTGGCRSLFAAILQEVLGMRRDPKVGQ